MYKRKPNNWLCCNPVRTRGATTFKQKKKGTDIYNQKDINAILYNTPLSVVIGDYVVLRKSGQDFVGRCPFCKELTHNDYHFRISDKKKKYKCFECGFGGTMVSSFIMKYYNIPFDRALRFINAEYYRYKFPLRIEGNVVNKAKNIIDDDLPF